MHTFNLTPDPKILIALTHTPLKPLDALCELIDNSIDSFSLASLKGEPIKCPMVIVELPKKRDLEEGKGCLHVRDNGPGLKPETAEKSIRAGFSGNNPYDSLGLFGMGFNIATGKIGKKTKFLTGTQDNESAIEVLIDLDKLSTEKSYEVPYEEVAKPNEFNSGTIIEISNWWPEGNANSNFIKKLIQYGMPTIRRQIGRRYASILKQKNIRIIVNDEPCESFEHCVWADRRFVERRNHGKISALNRFNNLIGSHTRCTQCNAITYSKECENCGSIELKTIEERIKGWVGIQRFDHDSEFGIDLIRNGRAIRIAEKSAFFEYTDELKQVIKDYPIDSIYGRIVGEIELNHIPVDFLKQDFQRTSPEWARAMDFLRGDSSLQPNKPNAGKNQSPIFMLYQGYRRVRTPGKADLYMGYWDNDSEKSKRISRDIEKDYYEKFQQKLPGFYDDAEWYKLVDQADKKPLADLVECPACSAENLQEHEICTVCGEILIPKQCKNPDCNKIIQKSALSCEFCGKPQIPTIQKPWVCYICGTKNQANQNECIKCISIKGAQNPLDKEYLESVSDKDDSLSLPGFTIELANSERTAAIDVIVHVTRSPIKPHEKQKSLPAIVFKENSMDLFIDLSHPIFRIYNLKPEFLISEEVALFIYDRHRSVAGSSFKKEHNLTNIAWSVMKTRWSDSLEFNSDNTNKEVNSLFSNIKTRVVEFCSDIGSDFYHELSDKDIMAITSQMLSEQIDVGLLGEMRKEGTYIKYIPPRVLQKLFIKEATIFLNGNVWKLNFPSNPDLPSKVQQELDNRLCSRIYICLGDLCDYLEENNPDGFLLKRTIQSLEYLNSILS